MNKVILLGRLVKDPEVRVTQGAEEMTVARYTLAIDRPKQKGKESAGADFISCVAFRKAADFASKYLHAGTKVLVEGTWHTGSYTNRENRKVYTNECYVEKHEFADGKKSGEAASNATSQKEKPEPLSGAEGFMDIPNDIENSGLPFN